MDLGDREVSKMAIQWIELFAEYDLCDFMPDNVRDIQRARVSDLLYSLIILSKGCGVRNKIMDVIKKYAPHIYLKCQYVVATYDKLYEDRLNEEMVGDVGVIKESTKSIIDKLSKMGK